MPKELSHPAYRRDLGGGLVLRWSTAADVEGIGQLYSYVFRNKPVGVIGSSAGMFGAVWAQAELRKVLAAMGARVAEVEIAVGHGAEKFDEDGVLVDDDVRELLGDALSTLRDEVRPALVAA